MKNYTIPIIPLVYLVSFLVVSSISYGQSIWTIINPSPPWDTYIDVQFSNDSTGWALGEEGRIVKTTNGGVNWEVLNPLASIHPYSFDFTKPDKPWIADYYGLYKSTDSGYNWEQVYIPDESGFGLVYFISELTGFLHSREGRMLKTTDGGNNWALVKDNFYTGQIDFINDSVGYAINSKTLIRTTDRGNTWPDVLLQASISSYLDFFFIDEDNGWVAGRNSLLLNTTNGGSTWDTVAVPTQEDINLQVVHFYNDSIGKVFTKYECFNTFDAGLSWEIINVPTMEYRNMSFPTDNYICSVYEEIQFSVDTGLSWSSPEIGHDNYQEAICLGENDEIFIAGSQGTVFFSDDHGETWDMIQTPTNEYLYDIVYVGGNTLWVVGRDGALVQSTDNGETWNMHELNTDYDLLAIAFSNPQNGIIVGKMGTRFTTQNGGATWTDNTGITNLDLYDIFMINENTGWICGEDGTLLKTDDGGNTWTLSNSQTTRHLYNIYFHDEYHGWVSGSEIIISTNNGGTDFNIQLDDPLIPYYSNKISSIQFFDNENGWAVGDRGLHCHTTDGGLHWVFPPRIMTEDLNDLVLISPTEAMVVGDYGYILYTDRANYQAPMLLNQSTDTILCEHSILSIECLAIGDSLNYQWFHNNDPISGENASQFEIDPISIYDGGLYACRIFNDAGSVETNDIMVSVKPKVWIVGNTPDTTIYETDTIQFQLAITGALPIYYQWQKNGTDIPGAIYNVYPIYGVQHSDSGYYRCIVSNDCNVDTTLEAKLTVLPASGINEKTGYNSILIFPNPVEDYLKISFKHKIRSAEYKIFNQGGILKTYGKISGKNNYEIDTKLLNPGIYILHLSENNNSHYMKFLKL